MIRPKRIVTKKVEVLVKIDEISISKLEFDNSTVEIKVPYLLIHTREPDSFDVTTKIFNLSNVSAYKEYKELTKL